MATGGQIPTWMKVVLLISIQICLVIFLFMVDQGEDGRGKIISKVLKEARLDSTESTNVILIWTYPFDQRFPLNQCPPHLDSSRCLFTDDRELYFSADAVVIHHREVSFTSTQLPQGPRNIKQYWIWFNLESPNHSQNLHFMEKKFNLTMSYRADSDIFAPYGYLQKHNSLENFTIPKKSKLVAWVVSNWIPSSRRIQFYKELKKHITIDVYGRQHLPLSADDQIDTLSKYKFYLAFENSAHEDYITEKLWHNALTSGTVPIVMGPSRGNYERFIPAESFIHVEDFSNAQELAAYLLKLDQEDLSYQHYFTWRSRYKSSGQLDWDHFYCKVCKALKEAPPYRTRPSIEKWFI
uniref:Fucosyltransferase n=1 Tax=Leptobrachium leishanense TaxID=445787 RepID=A0A8C5W6B5_9ANUR